MKSRTILVTGGAGYIGSHMVRLLLEEGFSPVVFDNFSTGHRSFVPRKVPVVRGDLRKKKDLAGLFDRYRFDAVMHFAASIVVPESVREPLLYYENNFTGTCNLVQAMLEHKVFKIIFSSTAAVYGEPKNTTVKESAAMVPTNPYGDSKRMIEIMLRDVASASSLRYVSLRYFNVAGSHPKADIGIRHKEVTHLIPSILRVASGRKKVFSIFGKDYPTKDGTCVRDFIYVFDLCRAHLQALQALDQGMASDIFNLGNGKGFSVKEVVSVAEKVTGKKIPLKWAPRRAGDAVRVVASFRKAKQILGWQPQTPLEEIVQTAWKWELAEQQR